MVPVAHQRNRDMASSVENNIASVNEEDSQNIWQDGSAVDGTLPSGTVYDDQDPVSGDNNTLFYGECSRSIDDDTQYAVAAIETLALSKEPVSKALCSMSGALRDMNTGSSLSSVCRSWLRFHAALQQSTSYGRGQCYESGSSV